MFCKTAKKKKERCLVRNCKSLTFAKVKDKFELKNTERNWVFAANSFFIILISLQTDVVDLRYFNSFRSTSLSLKYQRYTSLGCKDIGIRK